MAEETEPKAETKGPGMMTLVKAIAFVSVLVLLQIAGASMIIPSAEETTEIATQLATADLEETGSDTKEDMASEEEIMLAEDNMEEVRLGEDAYHVLNSNPDTGSRTNIDFELFATVLAEDKDEFMDLFSASENRIREQIIAIVRGSDISNFTDPNLGLIKRRILEKTNRSLGKPLLHEVIIPTFSFEER